MQRMPYKEQIRPLRNYSAKDGNTPSLGTTRAAGPWAHAQLAGKQSRPQAARPVEQWQSKTRWAQPETALAKGSSHSLQDPEPSSLSPKEPASRNPQSWAPGAWLLEETNFAQLIEKSELIRKSPFLVIARRYSIFTILMNNILRYFVPFVLLFHHIITDIYIQ